MEHTESIGTLASQLSSRHNAKGFTYSMESPQKPHEVALTMPGIDDQDKAQRDQFTCPKAKPQVRHGAITFPCYFILCVILFLFFFLLQFSSIHSTDLPQFMHEMSFCKVI